MRQRNCNPARPKTTMALHARRLGYTLHHVPCLSHLAFSDHELWREQFISIPPFAKLGITAQQGFDRTPAPEWSWGDGSSKNFGETSKVWMQPGTFYGRVTGFRGGVRVVRSFRTEVVENPVQTGSTNCAIRADKRVMCWGRNDLGQVGDNTRIERLTPRLVIGLSNAISIATSTIATCALKTDRSIACWGYRRAMGNGAVSDQLVAKTVSGLTDIRSLAGVADHFCVVKGDGTVLCWGTNSYGALGEGAPPTVLALPTSVSGVNGAITLALSTTRSCALKTDGTAVCWGSDPIAMPTDTMTSAEVDAAVALKTVSSPSEAVAIAAGGSHTCFLKMDGTVHCRGSNSWGMLGESPDLYKRDEVASVPGVSGILAISATSNSTCGLKANSTVLCWGYNNGWALNPASSDLGLPPTVISGLSGVTAVSTTGSHACALATTGRLICWGNNESGRLGTGTKSFRSPPVPVSGGAVFWK